MIRPILTYPDPELKKKSAPVVVINDAIRELVQDMAETMYHAPGIGLAAPQVGVHQRVIVIDLSGEDEAPLGPTTVAVCGPWIIGRRATGCGW